MKWIAVCLMLMALYSLTRRAICAYRCLCHLDKNNPEYEDLVNQGFWGAVCLILVGAGMLSLGYVLFISLE